MRPSKQSVRLFRHLTRSLPILMAGFFSLSPAIHRGYPSPLGARETPTSTPRLRITEIYTFITRTTGTSTPPQARQKYTETPIPPTTMTPTATISPETQRSVSPTPTLSTQNPKLTTPEPTADMPGSKQPNDQGNLDNLRTAFAVLGIILAAVTILLAIATFGFAAALIAASVIAAAALIGGVVSSASGGGFWDGFMLGAILGAISIVFTSFIANIRRSPKKKKKHD